MHICVVNLTIIDLDNGLAPTRRQAIIWTNDGILLIGPLGTNFSEILSKIHTFSFMKIHLKTSFAKWQPICLCLNVISMSCYLYFWPSSCIKRSVICVGNDLSDDKSPSIQVIDCQICIISIRNKACSSHSLDIHIVWTFVMLPILVMWRLVGFKWIYWGLTLVPDWHCQGLSCMLMNNLWCW